MKSASIHQLKQELAHRDAEVMKSIILRMAKYKAENKELLTYLLLEADDEEGYIDQVKGAIDEQLETVNTFNTYYAKKGMRKVVRYLQKWIRYSGLKTTEAELRIYFCRRLVETSFPINESLVMQNMYNRQLKNIEKSISHMHEDLQYDFHKELEMLTLES